jgi:hypothetical protein
MSTGNLADKYYLAKLRSQLATRIDEPSSARCLEEGLHVPRFRMSQTNVTWYVSDLKLGVCVEFQRWTGVEKRCRIGAIMRCASTDPPDSNCDTYCEHEELSVTLTLIH